MKLYILLFSYIQLSLSVSIKNSNDAKLFDDGDIIIPIVDDISYKIDKLYKISNDSIFEYNIKNKSYISKHDNEKNNNELKLCEKYMVCFMFNNIVYTYVTVLESEYPISITNKLMDIYTYETYKNEYKIIPCLELHIYTDLFIIYCNVVDSYYIEYIDIEYKNIIPYEINAYVDIINILYDTSKKSNNLLYYINNPYTKCIIIFITIFLILSISCLSYCIFYNIVQDIKSFFI
jgi:hypothetical protein